MGKATSYVPATTTVAALSDQHLLQRIKELAAVEHHLKVVVIDHLRELERRRLYLSLGFSSLFDYAMRELGYSDGAAWRRIKAMRLCVEVKGARTRIQDGTLTLNAAAELQHAFERQERKQASAGRGSQAGARSAAAPSGSAPGAAGRAPESDAAPVPDSAERESLVARAAGKSTRQVKEMLAEVDPDLARPVERMRPLGAGRWELKAVIDDDCRSGLDQLKGLLSHVDPQMTLGGLLGRVVQEAVERHDPSRPPRRRRRSRRTADVADETSAPKEAPGPAAAEEPLTAKPAGITTSAPKVQPDSEHRPAVVAARVAMAAPTVTSAPKEEPGAAAVAVPLTAKPTGITASAPRVQPDSAPGSVAAAVRLETAAPSAAPAPKAESAAQREDETSAPKSAGPDVAADPRLAGRAGGRVAARQQPRVRGRGIPAAVRRQVWERDRGCCSYVDRGSGRRCGSRHRLEIDHVLPYALGGGADPDNLRLLCAAHHRYRHARRAAPRGSSKDSPSRAIATQSREIGEAEVDA